MSNERKPPRLRIETKANELYEPWSNRKPGSGDFMASEQRVRFHSRLATIRIKHDRTVQRLRSGSVQPFVPSDLLRVAEDMQRVSEDMMRGVTSVLSSVCDSFSPHPIDHELDRIEADVDHLIKKYPVEPDAESDENYRSATADPLPTALVRVTGHRARFRQWFAKRPRPLRWLTRHMRAAIESLFDFTSRRP